MDDRFLCHNDVHNAIASKAFKRGQDSVLANNQKLDKDELQFIEEIEQGKPHWEIDMNDVDKIDTSI